MEAIKIVPDVIGQAPPQLVQITYPNGVTLIQENELTSTQVKDRPSFTYASDPNEHYQILVEYIGSGPPKGTGLRRYVYLVFKQTGKLSFDELHVAATALQGRFNTIARQFFEKYYLGNPIFGNFYLAQYDDYVPVLHASLI